MKLVKTTPKLPSNCTLKADGSIYARVMVGAQSDKNRPTDNKRFYPGVDFQPGDYAPIIAWQTDRRTELLKTRAPKPTAGTLAADVLTYKDRADLTGANRVRRSQQHKFWLAQSAQLDAPVLTPAQVQAGERGRGKTLGEVARTKIDPARIRQILQKAFAPSNPKSNPTQFAGTSNHYRFALYHLYTVLDQDDAAAVNPVARVKVRPLAGAQLKGQDMRVVREILRHVPTTVGRPSGLGELRLNVLAWVHITPAQLMQLDPKKDFHDVPDATRDEIIGGAITLTKQPRLKGQYRVLPQPETIPLTPWGVEALRAFRNEPKAWGTFSLPSVNKAFKRACRLAQASLLKKGYDAGLVDDDGKVTMSVYQLKHSLATVASVASAGLVSKGGTVRQSAGVQRALDHRSARTTAIYTKRASDPILEYVNAATSRFLDQLFAQPLAPAAITVAKKTARR